MIHKDAKIHPTVRVWHSELSNIGKCQIGEGSVIHSHVWIGDNVIIGKNVKIQAFAFIPEGVKIEDNAFIGPRVTFTNDKYPPSHGKWSETLVKASASIGAGVTVLPGITIGSASRIGAGSVVTKSIPSNAIAYGNPAKVKGYEEPYL